MPQKIDLKFLLKFLRLNISMTYPELQAKLKKTTGIELSLSRLREVAWQNKIYKQEGGFTLAEAARFLNVDKSTLAYAAQDGHIKFRRRGRYKMITLDEMDRLVIYYQEPPPGWKSANQIAVELGYSHKSLNRAICAGHIKAVKRLCRITKYRIWFVDPTEPPHMMKLLQSGQTKIIWSGRKWKHRND